MIGRVAALTQRELSSSFFSPVAYIVGAVFVGATGWLFTSDALAPGAEASARPMLHGMAVLLTFAVPLLTMRVLAEEYATGTIEPLMTAPVTDLEVVLSKFLGVLVFFKALVAATLIYVGILFWYGDPDVGILLLGYLGIVLLGSLYVAVGVFASALTRYQLVAAMIGIGLLAVFTIAVDALAAYKGGAWRQALSYVNALGHFEVFAKGILDTRSLLFFVSSTLFFLLLAVKVLESKRWR